MGNFAPRDGAYRYAKWRARFKRDGQGNLPQSCSPMMERVLEEPVILARVQTAFSELVEIETLTRGVLSELGAALIQFPYYLAFARQLWKLTRRIGGAAAALEAAGLVAFWAARGLDQSVLEAIRYQVFNTSAPVGP